MRALRILLVEDEPVIAQHVRHLLEKKGHRVLQAKESEELKPLCDQFHPNIAILNFKQAKRTNGVALANSLLQKSNLLILLLTGARSKDMYASEAYQPTFPILYKPFTPKQLLNAVVELSERLDIGK